MRFEGAALRKDHCRQRQTQDSGLVDGSVVGGGIILNCCYVCLSDLSTGSDNASTSQEIPKTQCRNVFHTIALQSSCIIITVGLSLCNIPPNPY
jgi:hypothetical protein